LGGGADASKDGVVTTEEIAAFVDGGVTRATKGAQDPQWGAMEGTGTILMWDVRRLPAEARPQKATLRALVPGLEEELKQVHAFMAKKEWAEAEKRIRDLSLKKSYVELNLLLAEVYLGADALGNAALIEAELKRAESASP